MNKEVIQAVERLRAEVAANYNKMGLKASGNFERELKVTDYGSGVRLTAPLYVMNMENGRKPGKRPPMDVIKRWIRDKNKQGANIPEGAAFAIAKKIGKEGIKVPNQYNGGGVVSNIVTPQLVTRITEDIKQIIRVTILNSLIK